MPRPSYETDYNNTPDSACDPAPRRPPPPPEGLTCTARQHLTPPPVQHRTMMAVGPPPDSTPSGKQHQEEAVSPEWVAMEIADEREPLIMDGRSSNDFNTSHIQNAIHVTIPSLMLKRLRKGNLGVETVIKCPRFQAKWRTDTIVVYDDDTTDIRDGSASLISLIHQRLTEQGCQVHYLSGGFQAFQREFPDLCSGQEAEESTILGLRSLQIADEPPVDEPPSPSNASPFPVEVLPHLFLGNAKNSADPGCLSRNGITYILNVTNNIPNTFEGDEAFRYMKIPINDHWSQNLAASFPDAIAFIDEAREKNCGVLVHCLAGISRSVTVTVAYLMFRCHLSLNDAYDVVKKCKPNISPNFNFMGQLLDFEQTLASGLLRCTCRLDVHGDVDATEQSGVVNGSIPLRACKCKKETKTFFSSPTSTSSSVSSTSSMSSSSSLAMSSASSNTAFDYDIPPTPS